MHYRPIEFYFWAVPLAALVAVALLYGLKHLILGRFVGDLPRVCRRCKYDLAGLSKPSLCPECGRDLRGRRAVRCGKRVREPRRIASALALTIALVVAGALTEVTARAYPYGEMHALSDHRLVRATLGENPQVWSRRQRAANSILIHRTANGTITHSGLRAIIDTLLGAAGRLTHAFEATSLWAAHHDYFDHAMQLGLIDTSHTRTLAMGLTRVRLECRLIDRRDPSAGMILHWSYQDGRSPTHAANSGPVAFEIHFLGADNNPLAPASDHTHSRGASGWLDFPSDAITCIVVGAEPHEPCVRHSGLREGDTVIVRWSTVVVDPITREILEPWEHSHEWTLVPSQAVEITPGQPAMIITR